MRATVYKIDGTAAFTMYRIVVRILKFVVNT